MAHETRVLAILFADICDSTPLYERMGDSAAYDLNGACLGRLQECAARHGGVVIRTLGDGMLTAFPTADGAFAAAMDMQRTPYEGELRIKVGFHMGPVITEAESDVYGDAVNLAARLSSVAQAGEIMLSEETARQLSPEHRATTRHFDTTLVKGKSEPIAIYRVWDPEGTAGATRSIAVPSPTLRHRALLVAYGDHHVRLDTDTPTLQIGRAADCGLVVTSQHSSRHHAVISLLRDRYMLTDRSSHGTFVVAEGAAPVFLKRDTVQLHGTGTLSLGGEPGQGEVDVVRYQEIGSSAPG